METKPITDYLQASSGVKSEKALKFESSVGYKWIEPPINGFWGYVWPTDQTYHPLLNSNNYEIVKNVFAVQSSDLPENEKKEIKEKIQKIVEEGPAIKAWGSVYTNSFAFAIFLLILIILLILYGKIVLFTPVSLVVFLLAGRLIYLFAFVIPFARGRGLENWQEFLTSYNAKTATGDTSGRVLDEMQSESDRGAAAAMPQSNASAFTGSLIGSMLGTAINRKN